MTKKLLYFLLLVTATGIAQQGQLFPSPLRKLPTWVRKEFFGRNFDQQYTITFARHPVYLKGDFNGDGRKDFAIQVQDNKTNKDGIMILHGKKQQTISIPVSIVGAGKILENASGDFQTMDMWELLKSYAVPRINEMSIRSGDIIRLAKRGSDGGYIYWNGKQYAWMKEHSKKATK